MGMCVGSRLVFWCCGYIVDVLDEGNFFMLDGESRGSDGQTSLQGWEERVQLGGKRGDLPKHTIQVLGSSALGMIPKNMVLGPRTSINAIALLAG